MKRFIAWLRALFRKPAQDVIVGDVPSLPPETLAAIHAEHRREMARLLDARHAEFAAKKQIATRTVFAFLTRRPRPWRPANRRARG